MKTLRLLIIASVLITITIAAESNVIREDSISMIPHPDVKLIYVHVDVNESGHVEVTGKIQYTRQHGSSHGHLDLIMMNDLEDETIIGHTAKISTRRGLMGKKTRTFQIKAAQFPEAGSRYSLRFHENKWEPHSCEC